MEKRECEIVGDLLPLYLDGVCSPASAALVEAHLAACEDCRALRGAMERQAPVPEARWEGGDLFRTLRRRVFALFAALAVMVGCFCLNTGGAWEGGPAGAGHFAVTLVYLLFWGLFTVQARRYRALTAAAFWVSLVTFVSAAAGLWWRLTESGGFLAPLLAAPAAVPFYGLRWAMDWTAVYAGAAALSLGWLGYAARQRKKLRAQPEDR